MKKSFLIIFLLLFCLQNINAQKTISYKISEGKAYYKVEEVGKEPMYYRKKLVDGKVSMDFEKISNGIFGEQYNEVNAEVMSIDSADQTKQIEELDKKEKEVKMVAKDKEVKTRNDKRNKSDKSCSNAHFFVGGTAGVSYENDVLTTAVEPMVGYQFKGRWAVGCGLGAQTYTNSDTEVLAIINPFVRFNVWNNSRFYFDIKADGTVGLNGDMTYYSAFIEPSFRMSLNNHWQLSADFAFLGIESTGDEIYPVFCATAKGVVISAIYNF